MRGNVGVISSMRGSQRRGQRTGARRNSPELHDSDKNNNNLQIQEAQQIPSRINTQKSTVRHIVTKLLKAKCKQEILKISRKKKKHFYGNNVESMAAMPCSWAEKVNIVKR